MLAIKIIPGRQNREMEIVGEYKLIEHTPEGVDIVMDTCNRQWRDGYTREEANGEDMVLVVKYQMMRIIRHLAKFPLAPVMRLPSGTGRWKHEIPEGYLPAEEQHAEYQRSRVV